MKKLIFAILLLLCSCKYLQAPCEGSYDQIRRCEEKKERQDSKQKNKDALKQIRINKTFEY